MTTQTRYPVEVRERAVRMVFEHEDEYDSQWAAISSVAHEVGHDPGDAAQVGAPSRDRRRASRRRLPPRSGRA